MPCCSSFHAHALLIPAREKTQCHSQELYLQANHEGRSFSSWRFGQQSCQPSFVVQAIPMADRAYARCVCSPHAGPCLVRGVADASHNSSAWLSDVDAPLVPEALSACGGAIACAGRDATCHPYARVSPSAADCFRLALLPMPPFVLPVHLPVETIRREAFAVLPLHFCGRIGLHSRHLFGWSSLIVHLEAAIA